MADNSSAEVFIYMGGDTAVPVDVVRVRVHQSVTVIPESAFYLKNKLEEVELREGVLEIGECAFYSCKSLRSIIIPSTVTVIRPSAFSNSDKLETIQFNEGLLEIGPHAFDCCTSVKDITIPSTVRTIGEYAFFNTSLSCINLPDGIESIGESAFSASRLLNFRMPQSITTTTISREMFGDCESLFSLELSESTAQIGESAFSFCYSLRNVALPINAEIAESAFNDCVDFERLFRSGFELDTQTQIINALKHRFDNLPIHKMLYYQSYNNLTSDQINGATDLRYGQRRSLRSKLNPTGNQQDCLGMTPLHILACSTVQNIELYRILIDKYPDNMIKEDRWGAVPLLYAVWGNAPSEIMQFLGESYLSLYPNYQLNFTKMMETLGGANVTTEVIQNLFDLQLESFPEQDIDWETVITQLDGHNLSDATFKLLFKCSITKRVNAIGLKQLRDGIAYDVQMFWPLTHYSSLDKSAFRCTIQSKLTEYEATYSLLKETTTTLELALWKNKMDEQSRVDNRCNKRIKVEEAAARKECRISCGADVVIQHVLPYLLPEAAVIQSDDDSSESESDSDSDSSSDSGIESD